MYGNPINRVVQNHISNKAFSIVERLCCLYDLIQNICAFKNYSMSYRLSAISGIASILYSPASNFSFVSVKAFKVSSMSSSV